MTPQQEAFGLSKRYDFECNQTSIRDAYMKILGTTKRRPKIKELEKETGLSGITIRKHLKIINRKGFGKIDKYDSLRVLTDDVKLAIFRSAVKGNPAAQKLWLQVMEGFTEKTETKLDAKVKTVSDQPPIIIKID